MGIPACTCWYLSRWPHRGENWRDERLAQRADAPDGMRYAHPQVTPTFNSCIIIRKLTIHGPTNSPAFLTTILAAAYVIGKILAPDSISLSLIYFWSRSATFWGKKATSASFPLLVSFKINFRLRISLGVNFST